MRIFTLFISLVLWTMAVSTAQSQTYVVQGKVQDEQTGEYLPFVNIGIKGLSTGTFSDSNGIYSLEIKKGDYIIVFSCLGYDKKEYHITTDTKRKIQLDVDLTPAAQELNTIVVSGSKYEQKVENSSATIEVMKSTAIQVSNPSSIDKAIEKIPGITIVDNEPQIRGGSGFSSGMGSRVMVMVDDIPVLRGDAGRPDWGFLPVDDVEQIEVVKGASSVVYGSSAITGAINIRTAYPKDKPESTVNAFVGVYSAPQRQVTKPWTGMNPLIYGLSLSHLQKSGNLDLGFGVNYYDNQGFIGSTPEHGADTNFNKGQFERRAKVYFNTRVRNKRYEGLTYGINGNFMYSDKAEAYFWYDSDTNIYRPYPGSLSHFKEFSFFVDPYIKYFDSKGNSHSLKNRIYYGNSEANNNQSGRYTTIYDEYQYTHKFNRPEDLILVAGFTNIYTYSYGKVFSGVLSKEGTTTANQNGEYKAENFSVYCQLEKKFFKRLSVVAGGRWEYFQIASTIENSPIFRAGLNLQAAKGTYIRASAGQGYRAPSIGERYITTNSGGFGFYPNPDLKSESCQSYELGIKQVFRVGKLLGMADVSGFLEYYKNYVELNFGIWGGDSVNFKKDIGFRFLNTGPARIYGLDMTLSAEGKLVRNVDIAFQLGYTYSVPQALDPDNIYYSNYQVSIGKVRNYTYANSSSDTTGNILKYRMQHLFKSDLQVTLMKRFAAGLSGRYYGYMKNVDIYLYQLDTPTGLHSGIVSYRKNHHNGNFIVDARVSYTMGDFKFSFLVNNFFNTEYSMRPMTIEAPRTTSLQVLLKI